MRRIAARARRLFGRLVADFPMEAEALWRRVFWTAARRFTPALAVDREGMRLFVSTDDQVGGRRLFVYHRVPERDIDDAFAVLRALPQLAAGLEGRTVIEIGGNIGSHTVVMVKRFGAAKVVAVEPDPRNCELLRANALVNGVADSVELIPSALSDRESTVKLELSPINSGDHRVRVDGAPAGGAEAGWSTIDVPATTLDSLVREGIVDPAATGLIWMDAQGHEAHILKGAATMLGSPTPIVMEYWPYGLHRAGALDLLHELIAEHYPYVIDVHPAGDGPPQVIAADRVPGLGQAADEGYATDLVLAPGVTPKLELSAPG